MHAARRAQDRLVRLGCDEALQNFCIRGWLFVPGDSRGRRLCSRVGQYEVDGVLEKFVKRVCSGEPEDVAFA